MSGSIYFASISSDIHRMIFNHFTPYTWLTVFSRVSKQWKQIAYSNELWLLVSKRLLNEIPSFEDIYLDGYPMNYPKGYHWCSYIIRIYLTKIYNSGIRNSALIIWQLAKLNIHSSILDYVIVTSITQNRNKWWLEYTINNTNETVGKLKIGITNIETRRHFSLPMRQLILHNHIDYEKCILWKYPAINNLFIGILARKRKRIIDVRGQPRSNKSRYF